MTMISGFVGYEAGKNHVIKTQEIWVMEFYPEDSEFDVGIVVEVDGELYDYDGYIG